MLSSFPSPANCLLQQQQIQPWISFWDDDLYTDAIMILFQDDDDDDKRK
jgi:hypothetical protein